MHFTDENEIAELIITNTKGVGFAEIFIRAARVRVV